MAQVKPYQQKIIDLYIQQELKLAELYQLLADRVPALAEEFAAMQNEELSHAQWVEYLGRSAADGAVLFQEEHTRSYTLQAFLDHISEAIERAASSPLAPPEALAISVSMEESLLERKVFEHFHGDAGDAVRVLQRLRTETQQHLARVRGLRSDYADQDGNLPLRRVP